MMGIVYLIGAGPGDYKLITVKGRECIEKADVIVYDYLADAKILRWARPDAELIYAGKKVRNHTMHQYEINELLVKYGLAGKVVARLKGGDPLIFGRGGEEALALQEAGVPFEFVPGVTSGIAAPAYAGIPVTQRAMATSFAIVTGHEDPTKEESGINWKGLATAVDTISFVMGVGHLPTIASELIAHGRPADTPVAVIRWGTKAEQQTIVSTLEHVADDVAKANIKPPALITVGQVVNLREQLRWFDNKPLFGKTIVVTRARAQASELTDALENLGANVLETPAIRTQILPITAEMQSLLANLADYDMLTFTSAQGVRYFFEVLNASGKDARMLGNIKVCAIGIATAKVLQNKGILADVIPANYQGESVVKAITDWSAEVKLKSTRILLIQPKVAREVIPEGLRKAGFTVDILRLYETVQADEEAGPLIEALALGSVDYLTFTSSSTVTNTLRMLGDDALALLGNTKVVCIGPITAATCVEHNIKPTLIGETFTIPAMVDLIKTNAMQNNSGQ